MKSLLSLSPVLFLLFPASGVFALDFPAIPGQQSEGTFYLSHECHGPCKEFTIIHTSDVHGYGFVRDIEMPMSDEKSGGLFSLATLIEEKRRRLWRNDRAAMLRFARRGSDDGILTLDAGDAVSGTYDDSVTRGSNMVVLMNAPELDYDAGTIGNHSTDYGMEAFYRNICRRRFPTVISNAVDIDSASTIRGTLPYLLKTVCGVRVGVMALSHPRATRIEGVRIEDIVSAVKKYAPYLRRRCDVLVCLSHLGLDNEEDMVEALAKVDDDDGRCNIDIIIDGHSHSNYAFMVDEDTLAVQAGYYGMLAGELDVHYDPVAKRVFRVDVVKHSLKTTATSPSPRFLRRFAKLVERVGALNDAVVVDGLDGFFMKKTPRRCDRLPNPAAEFVARSILEEPFLPGSGVRVDMAVVYHKGVRESVAANDDGEVTREFLHRVIPFDEKLCVVKLKGKRIRRLVEKGLRKRFSWAGIRVSVKEEREDGNIRRRLEKIEFYDRSLKAYRPLSDDEVYNLACVSFFLRVFVRPDSEPVITAPVGIKHVLTRFLGRYRDRRDDYFTGADKLWPSIILH